MSKLLCAAGALLFWTLVCVAAMAAKSENHVVMITSFAWQGDSAAAFLEQGVRYALDRAPQTMRLDVVNTASPYETVAVCDSLMRQEGIKLVVYAGDEGNGAAVALLSATLKIPVLKLTNDSRSFTTVSPMVVEFLPSAEAQAEHLALFAANRLEVQGAMALCPEDARGRALLDGFARGIHDGKKTLEAQRFYPAEAMSVRAEVAALFADSGRSAAGGGPVASALSAEERAEVFGDAQKGEVLFVSAPSDSDTLSIEKATEAFFFALNSDKIDLYAKQLPVMPAGTVLLGNSSWLNTEALERQERTVNGMYLSAPLLPETADTSDFLRSYQATFGVTTTPWDLLGLDAGEFIGQVFRDSPKDRNDLIRKMTSLPFTGRAVVVDFRGGRENRRARILQYENGAFTTIE